MTTRDYALSPLDSPRTQRSLAVRTTSELLPRRREVAGVFAAIKRFLGAGGYETYYESRQRVDVAQLTKALRDHGASVSSWFKLNATALGETSDSWTETFNAEIRGRRKAIRDRMSGIITTEERAEIRERLGTILTRLEAGIRPEWIPAADGVHPSRTESVGYDRVMKIPRYSLSALRFAREITEQRFIIARQHYLRRATHAARSRITIWGWDRDALERFAARFFPEFGDIHLTDPVATRYGNQDVKRLLVIDETRTSLSRAKLEAAQLTSKPTSLFVVLDPGAMTSAAVESPIHGPLNKVAGRFIVIQSLAGVWASEHFVPTLVQLQRMLASADVRQDSVHGFLANDDDIRRSVLLDALLNTSVSTPTVKEEMAWIEGLGFGEDDPVSATNFVGRVLREWQNRNETQSQ